MGRERELIFGLHVHVGLDRRSRRSRSQTRFAPGFRSCSRPRRTRRSGRGATPGSHRRAIKVFETFPRSGLPPAFACSRSSSCSSSAGWDGLLRGLHVHLVGPPAASALGTIEIRICDGTDAARDDGGHRRARPVASRRRSPSATRREGALPIQPRPLIEENKWRAARFGLEAQLSTSTATRSARPRRPLRAGRSCGAGREAARLCRRAARSRLCSTVAAAQTSSGGSTLRRTATCSASRSGWPNRRSQGLAARPSASVRWRERLAAPLFFACGRR